MRGRVLLVLPTATYRATAFLRAAAALGLDAVVASDQAPSLATRMEGRSLTLDLAHPEQAADLAAGFARSHPIDAVVGVDEGSVLAAAWMADRLGLGGNPVAAVAATRDKRLLRGCLAAASLTQPRWIEATTAEGAQATAERAIREVGLPCVVKPVDLAASRGVIRADTGAELAAAVSRVAALLRRPGLCGPDGDPPLLVEEFVSGPEIAVEGIVREGELTVLTVFDKPDPLDGPYFAETLYVTPSRHAPDTLAPVHRVLDAAVEALGLRSGPVHAELRLGPDGPVVIELAARSIGGRCSAALRLRDGDLEMSLEELILRVACGLPLGSPRLREGAAGVLMLPVTEAGTLAGVEGVAAAAATEGVASVEITVPRGTRLEPLPEGDRYLGFVVARGAGPAAVETALRRAWDHLQVRMTSVTTN